MHTLKQRPSSHSSAGNRERSILGDKATTVILVRHGASTWNEVKRWQGQGDPPLGELGQSQARRVAERLRPEPITTLYASDLQRALETAQIIGQTLGLEPQVEPRLRELDVGVWSGLTLEEIGERHPEQFKSWQNYEEIRPGGGELFAEMQQRSVAALEEIIAAHPGETVCAVTHGGIVYAIRGHVLGLRMGAKMFRELPPNRNTALTIVRYQDGEAELLLIMDASHLDDEPVFECHGDGDGGDQRSG